MAIPASVLRKSLDDAVTASLGCAGCMQGYTLMQLQRGLATDSTNPMAMTEDGYHCVYFRLPADLFQDLAETQKAALNAALPHEIAILGTKFGLRHEFETHYCGLCNRAGHKWGTCRKPALTSVSAPSAPVPGARTSTLTPTPTGGFRVAGKNGKHGGPTPLTSRASGTNMIQLGPRTNPATDLASANNTDEDDNIVEGGDATSTNATAGSENRTQTTAAAPIASPVLTSTSSMTPPSPSPTATGSAPSPPSTSTSTSTSSLILTSTSSSPLSGGTSGTSATTTSTSPRRLRSSLAPGNRRVTRAGSAMIHGASGGDDSGGNSSGGYRSEVPEFERGSADLI
ncbi:hypothetical protein MVLG_07096 [Microbotryum lychnidis-dioicae p1A1 Lamole]|uniref:Uncharacterized protein n=1 Tax=Microbotryum lychnidis-dioicae (strain p1A1 Lamole / MvSl-1064) TaxID=683840 RepID=U5HJA9_USTV1|nr:hypothetical protein MVLG_07096 [Microbotryum lychnidis-dioicae p1A1 Lamole]|eukprot:KDE02338.1 hypothetical protein MVLG_07096 [Microbotryum lychnidis-dioicae p1A1 Lamole]